MARRRPQVSKVDANHARIVEELRAVGFSVESTARVANGFPDIVVGWAGRNWLFEIKVTKLMKKTNELRPEPLNDEEEKWHTAWKGQKAVVTDSRQVVEVISRELGLGPRDSALTPAMLALLLL